MSAIYPKKITAASPAVAATPLPTSGHTTAFADAASGRGNPFPMASVAACHTDTDHDWRSTNCGSAWNREYQCTKCGAVEDRDVS